MVTLRSFFFRWLVAVLLAPQLCFGLATDSAMQKMLSSLYTNKLASRGVASSASNYASTFTSIGSSVVGAAAGAAVVTAAAVTAPAWLTVGATVALGAVFSAGIGLAVDAAVKWAVGPDGTTNVSVPGSAIAGLVARQPYWVSTEYPQIYSGDVMGVVYARVGLLNQENTVAGAMWQINSCGYQTATRYVCPLRLMKDGGVVKAGSAGANYVTATDNVDSCAAGSAWIQGKGCSPVLPQPQVQTKTIQQAVDSLTAQELAQPVNPAVLAQIANAAWKSASAQPGYLGVPFDEANPITEAEAQAVKTANPDAWPKVEELVKPQPVTTATPEPFAIPQPATQTNPGTGTDPGANPGTGTNPGTGSGSTAIDWGTFSPPGLEATPTIESIMDPLLNLWPQWSSFAFPAHQSTCPTPSFTLPQGIVGGHTIHFVEMCDFLEANNVRQLLQAAFAVAWAIAIAFVVMGA